MEFRSGKNSTYYCWAFGEFAILWLLWILLLWTVIHMPYGKHMFLHVVVLYLLLGFLIHIFCFSRDSQRAFQCGYTSAHHQKKRISAFPPPPQTWHWLSFSFYHSDEWLVVTNCIFNFPLLHNYINPLVFCLCPYLGFLSFSHSFVETLCIVWIYSAQNKAVSLSLSYTLLFTLPVESFDKRSC